MLLFLLGLVKTFLPPTGGIRDINIVWVTNSMTLSKKV
ncbi:hypothetical protein L248_3081 [Schleiferilactobacillus shenzhenensis LY-73]|uniref:Uncharacterized protein n=1 Tax=Schleiferilactobacillus shenzhenensis LY-73 TaxID=1231336 RepID=U4TTD2_9LACO|nr:hypothetical protein L248_3081 [Schleiferilactobacillus shenzhenensis LY-73]